MFAICSNPACKSRYKISNEMIGKKAKCKKCSNTFTIEEFIEPQKILDLELVDDASNKENYINNSEFSPTVKNSYQYNNPEPNTSSLTQTTGNNTTINSNNDSNFKTSINKQEFQGVKHKEKSIPLAIGLNLVLPGLGYVYFGRYVTGIIALIIVLAIAEFFPFGLIVPWVSMNVIMAIDMVILGNKRKSDFDQLTTTKCPNCAEIIQKDAKMCKHCKSVL